MWFVSHNALLGCSKCLKPFPTTSFGEKPDYLGIDKINWTPRSSELHSHHAHLHKVCDTLEAKRQIERDVIMVVGTQFYWNCLILMLCVCVLLIPCIICYLGQQSICYLFGNMQIVN